MKTYQAIKIHIGIVFFLVSAIATAQDRSEREEDGFFGAVKSAKLTSYEAVTEGDGVKTGSSSGYQIRTYATDGSKVGVADYTGDDVARRTQTYTNDKKGYHIQLVDQMGETIIKKVTYTYDKKGHLLEKITYDGEGTIDNKKTFVYDKKGLLTEESAYSSSFGELQLNEKQVFQYNDQGNRIKTVYETAEGVAMGSAEFTYDANGNELSYKNLAEDGSILVQLNVTYNEENIATERTTLSPEGKVQRIAKLNERGQLLILEYYDDDGNLSRKSGNTYDDYGNNLSEIRYLEDGSPSIYAEYRYTYDDDNNWLRMEGIQDGQVAYIIERELTYYD